MISVLLPTRKRPDGLKQAVATLVDLAADVGRLEFLFATDTDDAPALDVLPPEIFRGAATLEWRTPRRGYHCMHNYYTELAKRAKGDLLFVWNDDTQMLTPKWDDLLRDAVGEKPLVQFIRRDIRATADDTFPIVDRRIFAALGHMARHCYVDTWLSKVSEAAGVRHFRDDIVFHHDRLQDQVQAENTGALAGSYGHSKWFELDAERAVDVKQITELLARLDEEKAI